MVSVVDLFSFLSILLFVGDLVMFFGFDGSTTVLMGTEALVRISI